MSSMCMVREQGRLLGMLSVEHLEELRKCFVYLFVFVGFVCGFFFKLPL